MDKSNLHVEVTEELPQKSRKEEKSERKQEKKKGKEQRKEEKSERKHEKKKGKEERKEEKSEKKLERKTTEKGEKAEKKHEKKKGKEEEKGEKSEQKLERKQTEKEKKSERKLDKKKAKEERKEAKRLRSNSPDPDPLLLLTAPLTPDDTAAFVRRYDYYIKRLTFCTAGVFINGGLTAVNPYNCVDIIFNVASFRKYWKRLQELTKHAALLGVEDLGSLSTSKNTVLMLSVMKKLANTASKLGLDGMVSVSKGGKLEDAGSENKMVAPVGGDVLLELEKDVGGWEVQDVSQDWAREEMSAIQPTWESYEEESAVDHDHEGVSGGRSWDQSEGPQRENEKDFEEHAWKLEKN